MDSDADDARSLAGPLVAIAILAPTLLGAFPVGLALVGLGFGPAAWVAVSWQLASMVTWTILSLPILRLLRRRTDANIVVGAPALTLRDDAITMAVPFLGAIVAHAATLAIASGVLSLGRGRPTLPMLSVDLLLLYAPMNALTLIGLVGAAVVAAEQRARFVEATLRHDLERQLDDARSEVIATLATLNGPVVEAGRGPGTESLDRIAVTTGNRTTMIAVEEIDWIEARSYYARLHVGARQHLVRQSMNVLEQRLDPKRFARIHRSTIVNLDRVVELRPFDRRSYVVVLRDGRRLMMSRRRRRLLDFVLP